MEIEWTFYLSIRADGLYGLPSMMKLAYGYFDLQKARCGVYPVCIMILCSHLIGMAHSV